MTFVIGVDGGGTRTRAVLTDGEGAELGRGDFAGSVVTAHEPERAAHAVHAAVAEAAKEAGIELPVDVIWAGLAGAGGVEARNAVTRALESRGIAETVLVGTDVEAAFYDAFGEGVGVLLIAGTGSIAWTRRSDGSSRQVGGWGQYLGDEGSGFAIGLAGLRYLTRAHDGRASPTAMRDALLAHCGVTSVPELVGWIEDASKSGVASLAPVVVKAADRGDPPASEIVADAVAALLDHVRVAHSGSPGAPVVLWGGLLAPGGPLRSRLVEALGADGVDVEDRELDPPLGAARLALAALS